jgi:hypothetical protein
VAGLLASLIKLLRLEEHRFPIINVLNGSILVVVLLLYITFHPYASHADMGSEIEHLIQYIAASGCRFIRNDKIHDNQNASQHIRKKYDHTKRWIKTTEDFIKYAATESSMSGRPYQVECNGIKTPTAEWLTEELARFRAKTQ